MTDFKEFVVDDARFGIGTIETASGADVLARRDELLAAMETLHERGSYTSVIFGIIDIVKVQTILLVVGHPEAVAATFEMPLVMARYSTCPPSCRARSISCRCWARSRAASAAGRRAHGFRVEYAMWIQYMKRTIK